MTPQRLPAPLRAHGGKPVDLAVEAEGALAVVAYLERKPERFGPGHGWGVEGSIKYWHFVDVAWVFIYPTLYLVGQCCGTLLGAGKGIPCEPLSC